MDSLIVTNHLADPRVELAPPVACTLDTAQAEEQLERVRALAPHLVAVTRTPAELTLSFGAGADASVLGAFVETERACCSFFPAIAGRELPMGLQLHYDGAPDHSHAAALVEIAGMFDVHTTAAAVLSTRPPRDRRGLGVVLGGLGLACSACLIPGLLAGGAGVLGAEGVARSSAAAIAAAAFAIAAAAAWRRRRRPAKSATSPTCGC